jgi:hypothetical protein
MTDIDRAFRDAEQVPVADLWPNIVSRTPATPPSRSPSPRGKAAVAAIIVAALGIGFLVWAYSEGGTTQPATRTTNPPVSGVPVHPAVVSHGLACTVTYRYAHSGAIHNFYDYRVHIENATNGAKRVAVGINVVTGPADHQNVVHKKGFSVDVPAQSTRAVTNVFRILGEVWAVSVNFCTTAGDATSGPT